MPTAPLRGCAMQPRTGDGRERTARRVAVYLLVGIKGRQVKVAQPHCGSRSSEEVVFVCRPRPAQSGRRPVGVQRFRRLAQTEPRAHHQSLAESRPVVAQYQVVEHTHAAHLGVGRVKVIPFFIYQKRLPRILFHGQPRPNAVLVMEAVFQLVMQGRSLIGTFLPPRQPDNHPPAPHYPPKRAYSSCRPYRHTSRA